VKIVCLLTASVFQLSVARGGLPYWTVNEAFSSADGIYQYVELATTLSNQQVYGSYELDNGRGQQLFIYMPYAGGSGNYTFLISTPGFASLPGAVQPDYTIPVGFLSTGAGLVAIEPYGARYDGTYGGLGVTSSLAYSQLFINGVSSFGPIGVNAINTPENYTGQIGFVVVPEPTFGGLFLVTFVTGLLFRPFGKRLVSR
jgi:hypothetical protein